jgi:hypothetical protein
VNSILGRTIQRENDGELSHEDLLATAREIGISEQAIERAAIEVAAEHRRRSELVDMRRDQWRGFIAHLIPYVMVNALLVMINALTTRFPWALFPALGWGIGLASHLWAVLFPPRQHQEYHLEQLRALESRGTRTSARVFDEPSSIDHHERVASQDDEQTDPTSGESDEARRRSNGS